MLHAKVQDNHSCLRSQDNCCNTAVLYIYNFILFINIYLYRCPQLRMVWITCEGETQADVENLGRVSYTPKQVKQII